ncbi:MAG: DUF4252 domain-containing protein [Steroidobacteraceae bacterium]
MYCRRSALLVLGFMLPVLCVAQTPALAVPSLAAMQRDAVDSVDITLGPETLGFLRFMSRFAGDHDPRGAAARDVLHGLHTVQIHSLQFASDHAYSQADLEALRAQLTAPGLHHLVQVRDSGTSENVDVYCALDNHIITRLVILAAEPREFTLVNIDGAINVDQVETLRHAFVPNHGRRALALSESDRGQLW